MIPVNQPYLGKEELKNVIQCVKSGWISSKGQFIKRFEEEFAEYCGMKYGISVTSGTTALHLALLSLGIKEGDEVILPTFTMVASAYAVLYTGARPVFVDSEERTWNMDCAKIEEAITKRTKAIMPVHIYGHPVDMDSVMRLAKKYKLYVVEDAAEAHGSEYKGRKCGSFGDFGCFSFYANKIITTGEGGMVVTNNKKLAERAELLKDLSHSPGKRFLHTDLGYNYRMTNMQAAVGLGQLHKIKSFISKKRQMASQYSEELKVVPGLRFPFEEDWAKSVYWMYSILIEDSFGLTRDESRDKLHSQGIETRTFFVPMHQQPVIRKLCPEANRKKYPVADYIAQKGLYLPSGLAITKGEIHRVCNVIKKIKKSI
ncbi:MAG: DegT/DnrJ/EryC1/StrS family aminotransferase [Candidatus Omnitrophica bacterium]|nr:DegT/DnrJ/EryC1/StrS family aminotransferase [Candidatus Omnitrophota bacterium]